MTDFTHSQLHEEILPLHALWLKDDPRGKRAVFRDFSLRITDLRRADLRRAVFNAADLVGADLRDTDLRGASLKRAYVRGTDFRRADLRGADLSNVFADSYTDFTGTGVIVATLGSYACIATPDEGFIGCQRHTAVFWREITDKQLLEMGGERAVQAWRDYGKVFLAMLDAAEKMGWPNND